MTTATQVAIVGGGPVAMTVALLLAGHGIESIVHEKAERRDPVGSKALCMQRDVLDVLARVGIGDQMVREGVTWTLGRTLYRDHELFQITFPDAGSSHFPPFVNLGQDRTEALLEERVQDSGLTDLRYGSEVLGVDQHESGVAVHTTTGDLDATYVVAADGAHSSVRKHLGVGFPGRSFDDRFLICDIRADLPFTNERRFFFDPVWNPGRQVLIHPQAGSVWRIDWQVPPDFDVDAEERSGGLDRRIRQIVGERSYEIVWKTVYRFHERVADSFRVGRVFLAGDAAHLFAPFGARGLNSGIQDAENIAWKLAYVSRGWAPDPLLDSYDAERRSAAVENLEITSKTMEFLVPTDEAQRRRRATVLEAALTDPEARRAVDSGKLAEPHRYVESALTTSRGPTPGAALVPGALCPDLRVHPSAGFGVRRLRELFGFRPVVLSSQPVPGVENVLGGSPPVDVHALPDLDRDGILRASVGAEDVGLVVRPDGHLAAITAPAVDAVTAAVRRSIGLSTQPK